MKALQSRLSYANVTATLALFIALGGSAFAATQLGRNTVGSQQLKRNAVVTAKIKNQAVTAAKIKNGTLTGTQIDVSTLGTVPKAEAAATARSAQTAQTAQSAQSAQSAQTAQTAAGLTPAEPWHEVGAPGEPAFQNSWKNDSGTSTNETLAFYKDQGGVVHLKGAISGGSAGSAAFELPPGFRPATGKILRMPTGCVCLSGISTTEIYGDGFVPGVDGAIYPYATAVYFEGITFRAAG